MTCHSSAFWKFCALVESTVQDAAAPPSEKLIVGADVYPLPPETNVMAVTAPPEMVAVADAPLPPPPENDIVGAEVYPVPPFVMVKVEDIVTGPHSALQDASGDDKLWNSQMLRNSPISCGLHEET